MDFNHYVDEYGQSVDKAVAFSGQEQGFYLEVKARELVHLAERHFGRASGLSMLDVGCGIGLMGRLLSQDGRWICGVDVAAKALGTAKRNVPEGHFIAYDGGSLPIRDDAFDVVLAVCVLHHVPPEAWPRFVAEMARTVKPGGLAVIVEHNPLNPLTRYVVSNCEFDRDAVLAPASRVSQLLSDASLRLVERRYFLFFPWAGRLWERVQSCLRSLPFGAQYLVAAEKLD